MSDQSTQIIENLLNGIKSTEDGLDQTVGLLKDGSIVAYNTAVVDIVSLGETLHSLRTTAETDLITALGVSGIKKQKEKPE